MRNRGVLSRGAVFATAFAVLLTVSSAPASAAAPDRTPVDDSFTFTNHFCSFPIEVATTITGSESLFSDRAGNMLRDDLHLFVSATWRNPLTGRSVIESDHVYNTVYPDGSFAEVGLNFRLSVSGGRTVLIDVGRLLFDGEGNITFEAGNHQVTDERFGPLCAALS